MTVLGGSNPGRKVRDLQEHAENVASVAGKILAGPVIAVEVFTHFVEARRFDENTRPEQLDLVEPTEELWQIVRLIAEKLQPQTNFIARSSAVDEEGGTGTYESEIFYATDSLKETVSNLMRAVIKVYASVFASKAKSWRAHDNAPMGMAVGKWTKESATAWFTQL